MCPVFNGLWRYSYLNVTHKKPYKRYEGKTNDLLIERNIGSNTQTRHVFEFEIRNCVPEISRPKIG
jgi:hypothetical protein